MKAALKKFSVITGSLFMLSHAQSLQIVDDPQIKQEGVRYIKMLGGALKKELKSALQKGGTKEAVEFCASKAMAITGEINAKLPKGVTVRRTAKKLRNSANKPDKIDEATMVLYEEKMASKKFHPKDILVVKEGNGYRVYKPLAIEKVCLQCHGGNIEPTIAQKIKELYPTDNATGFKVGDLRGVIVAHIKKDEKSTLQERPAP